MLILQKKRPWFYISKIIKLQSLQSSINTENASSAKLFLNLNSVKRK